MPYLEEGNAPRAQAHTADRKNVLLLGDSIRMGYCAHVRALLADCCHVEYPEENCRTAQYIIISMPRWQELFAASEEVDIIYFNAGHWDIAHYMGDALPLSSVEDYCATLVRVQQHLRHYYPHAKLIFATTTPMNPTGINSPNPRSNAEIATYNAAACRALQPYGVKIDDLHAVAKDWPADLYADYCHYTEAGFQRLGEHVAATLRQHL